jgi:hypothetical protein
MRLRRKAKYITVRFGDMSLPGHPSLQGHTSKDRKSSEGSPQEVRTSPVCTM